MNTETFDNSLEYWENLYADYDKNVVEIEDDWLTPFETLIERCNTPIPDLGCEGGHNTRYLTRKHKSIIACNFSDNALKNILRKYPNIYRVERFDMRDGIPFNSGSFEIVIADLCLHYFTDQDTIKILREIHRILTVNGHLLFRVNSIHDANYGAMEGKEIEHHLFATKDHRLKRFFKSFNLNHLSHSIMTSYGPPEKSVIIGCAQNINNYF